MALLRNRPAQGVAFMGVSPLAMNDESRGSSGARLARIAVSCAPLVVAGLMIRTIRGDGSPHLLVETTAARERAGV